MSSHILVRRCLIMVAIMMMTGLPAGSLVLAADEPSVATQTQQQQSNAPVESGQVQERAIRQGAGETGQCICMRPAGQCVFSAQGGCVSQRGNPCNGGCIMQESTPGRGSVAPALKGGGTRSPAGPGSMTK
jgi:hypothetical protein